MQTNSYECVTGHHASITHMGDNALAQGTNIRGITAKQDVGLTLHLLPNTKYLKHINIVCGRDITFGTAYVPNILYNAQIGRNIVSEDENNILYIDSISYHNFSGKFIGPWTAIYVYQYHMYPPDKFDLLYQDTTLINLVTAAAKLSL